MLCYDQFLNVAISFLIDDSDIVFGQSFFLQCFCVIQWTKGSQQKGWMQELPNLEPIKDDFFSVKCLVRVQNLGPVEIIQLTKFSKGQFNFVVIVVMTEREHKQKSNFPRSTGQ